MIKSVVRSLPLLGVLLAGALVLSAQPAPLQNLQVLPKDIARPQLMQTMQSVSMALGVRCNHCHVPREFHLDTKPQKAVARGMIRMVMSIKGNADEFLPDGRVDKLSCWTCHRGSTTIELPEPPTGRPGGGGGKKGGRGKAQ